MAGPTPPVQRPEEMALIDQLRRGDEAAFTTLVETHQRALLRLARLFVSSQAVAEEVVQDTWVGVISGIAAFEGRSSLKTWIFRILANRAKTRGVREGRSVPFSALIEPDESAVAPQRFSARGGWSQAPRQWDHATPERLLGQRQAMQRLQAAIDRLPETQRAVVTLRDLGGLDAAETCNILDISETNQRVLLHRARSRLRAVLEECVDHG